MQSKVMNTVVNVRLAACGALVGTCINSIFGQPLPEGTAIFIAFTVTLIWAFNHQIDPDQFYSSRYKSHFGCAESD